MVLRAHLLAITDGVHLLAVTGGVESDDALWIPLHAETGPKEDHAVLALQHI